MSRFHFLFKIIKLFQFLSFLFVQKHIYLRDRSSRDTQMFPSSENGSDFASINSNDVFKKKTAKILFGSAVNMITSVFFAVSFRYSL